jgi:c-di-GMP-binding flagellar brake protein YcgR
MSTVANQAYPESPISDPLEIIKTGLIVYIEDLENNSCAYGVKNVVNHELCICQALGKKKVTLSPTATNKITIVVPDENGAHLISAIIEEADNSNVKLTLRPTGEVGFVQRRRYFRLSQPNVNIQYQHLDDDGTEYPQLPVESIVWDISGDGAGLVIRSSKPLHTGERIKLYMKIPDHETMSCTGEIMRIVRKSIIRNESLVGVQFKAINEVHRDKLIRYITQTQLSLRKRNKR